MSEIAKQKLMETTKEVEDAKNKVYSNKFPYLIGMTKSLYKEFQELLGPGEVAYIYQNFSKEGIKMDDDKIIPAEEYVEKEVQNEKSDDLKFKKLYTLIRHIQHLERKHNKKLTEKYFKTCMQNEVAKTIFEKYGQTIEMSLEKIKSMIPELYDDLDKTAGISLTDEEKGNIILGMFSVVETLPKILKQAFSDIR